MAKVTFQTIKKQYHWFNGLMAVHALVILAGVGAFFYMEHHGHVVTGMNNQIVWGMPHVFAVFMIIAASGALNVASVSSVFNNLAYKPYARLSGLLAIALLVGGLAVLVLDLGRPERLTVAMLHNNFKSIFAWNIYLYVGFLAVVGAYLFVMMDRRVSRNLPLGKKVGWLAFVWRLILTTGTGSIFGFLIAREVYDSAVMAPMFIAASFLYGLAFTVLVLITVCKSTSSQLMNAEMVGKFRGLLAIFSLAVLYFTVVHHLTKLYGTEHHGAEAFLLRDGGVYTLLFWGGHVLLGNIVPLVLLATAGHGIRQNLPIASYLFLIGGLCNLYVTIIGGQAYPLSLFPGMEVSSSFGDGAVGHYVPSLPEILLGVSGISIAMFVTGIAFKLLPFLPAPAQE